MKPQLHVLLITLLVWQITLIGLGAAETAIGDTLPHFTIKDQFDREFRMEPLPKFILFGLDMDASRDASPKLAALGTNWLENHQAVYILDIHPMPAVARMFALPKMRKYPYRVGLVKDEKLLANIPRQPSQITVLTLSTNGQIQAVKYWSPKKESLEDLLH